MKCRNVEERQNIGNESYQDQENTSQNDEEKYKKIMKKIIRKLNYECELNKNADKKIWNGNSLKVKKEQRQENLGEKEDEENF